MRPRRLRLAAAVLVVALVAAWLSAPLLVSATLRRAAAAPPDAGGFRIEGKEGRPAPPTGDEIVQVMIEKGFAQAVPDLERALADKERGLGGYNTHLDEDAMAHLIKVAGGDARNALNALELAVVSTPADDQGVVRVTLEVAQESIQRRAVLYDKDGDAHYDTISAFIKSVRGSDPDAALYWLAKMLYAGEDPRFIVRRLLILAGEDIGQADPMGMVVASAAAQAFDYVGMPEGIYPIVHATIYLATAPKSNTATAYFKAYQLVEQEGITGVPNHLKDANRDAKALGHGEGYQYPHEDPSHFLPQQYLPDALLGTYFYQPSAQGYEQQVAERLARWREAQRKALGITRSENIPDMSEEEVKEIRRRHQTSGGRGQG